MPETARISSCTVYGMPLVEELLELRVRRHGVSKELSKALLQSAGPATLPEPLLTQPASHFMLGEKVSMASRPSRLSDIPWDPLN